MKTTICRENFLGIVAEIVILMTLLTGIANADTVQITDNGYDDYGSQTGSGKIVWSSYYSNGISNEIYMYDTSTAETTRITNNNYWDGYPQIDNGKIVWSGSDDGYGPYPFIYDIASKTTTKIGYVSAPPTIGEGKVVFTAFTGGNDGLYMYDIATMKTIKIADNGVYVQIGSGKIVWSYHDGNDLEIYMYDITTAETIKLTDNSYEDFEPEINNGKIVWWNGNLEVYMYDISTAKTTRIAVYSSHPSIDNGKVIWSGHDGNNLELYLYDIETTKITKITEDNYYTSGQNHINNGIVVWMGWSVAGVYGDNDLEIYMYDITTTKTTRITNNNYRDWDPIIGDGKIIWSGYDGNDMEIYMYTVKADALGFMTGGGSILAKDGSKVTHGFELNCDKTQVPNNLEINWGKGNKFHLDTLTSASCSDDSLIDPGQSAAKFDTYKGTGTGKYNGIAGATAEWTFTDAGEPGVNDIASIDIKDANGNLVLTVSGKLKNGNQRAHPPKE